jgi:hypothetical protein
VTFEGVRVSVQYDLTRFAYHIRFEDTIGIGYDFLVDDDAHPVEGYRAFEQVKTLPLKMKYRYEIAVAKTCL